MRSLTAVLVALQAQCSRRGIIQGLCAATSTQLERGACSASSAASPDCSSSSNSHQYTWAAAVAAGGLLSFVGPACAMEPQPAQKPDFEDPLVAAAMQGADAGLEALTSSPGAPGHATQMGVSAPWATSEASADLLQRRRLAENRLRGYLAVKQREVQAWWVPHACIESAC